MLDPDPDPYAGRETVDPYDDPDDTYFGVEPEDEAPAVRILHPNRVTTTDMPLNLGANALKLESVMPEPKAVLASVPDLPGAAANALPTVAHTDESATAVASGSSMRVLNDLHRATLVSSAVSPEYALANGVWSAETPADLPDDLAGFVFGLPGMVFTHHTPDGKVIHQFRPDEPKPKANGKTAKYLQAKGSGSVLSINPSALGKKHKSMRFVEGTKQRLAVDELSGDDILVVGIQGVNNWTSGGNPLHALDELVEGVEQVICYFDADVATNRGVHDAAQMLELHLTFIGVKDIRFVEIPWGAKSGIDDYLAERSPDKKKRAAILDEMAEKAKPLTKRKPRAKKQATSSARHVASVNWGKCEIREPGQVYDGVETPGALLADFAARIVTTYISIDDLTPANPQLVCHDLEVTIDGGVYKALRVPDQKLDDVRKWLTQLPPGARATAAFVKPRSGESIAESIRVFSADMTVRYVTEYRRTGWIELDGLPFYLHPGGAIGNGMFRTDIRSNLSDSKASRIELPDPADASAEDLKAYVTEFLEVFTKVVDQTPLYAMLGNMAYTATGAGAGGGTVLDGPAGSGKTHQMGFICSLYSAYFAPKKGAPLMASMTGTGNAVGAIGKGLHNMCVMVDDVRPLATKRLREAQDEGLEELFRRTYGGGSAGKARLRVDPATNEIVSSPPDPSNPGFIFSSEPGAWRLGKSSIDRALSIPVTSESSMIEGGADWMVELAESGKMPKVWSAYLNYVAGEIETAGSAKAYERLMAEARTKDAKKIQEAIDGLSKRGSEVAAMHVTGAHEFMMFAASTGAITDAQATQHWETCLKLIEKAARRHMNEEMGGNVSSAEEVMEKLRQLLGTGNLCWVDSYNDNTGKVEGVRGGVQVLGRDSMTKKVDTKTIECVAIIPEVAAKAARMSVRELSLALRSVSVQVGDRYGHTASMHGGQKIRNAILIPTRLWVGCLEECECGSEKVTECVCECKGNCHA